MSVIETVERVSGVKLCLHEASFKLSRYIPDIPVFHRNSTCMSIKKCLHGERQCIMFDRNAVKYQLRHGENPFFKRCPFGVTELVLPLLRNNELLGIVFLGPFRCDRRLLPPGSLIGSPPPALPEEINSLAAKLPEHDRKSMQDMYNLGSMLKTYFGRVLENIIFDYDALDNRRQQIEKFIDRNFTSSLQISDLAEFLLLSESRTGQLLKEYFNCGFSKLLTARRMEHARSMLERSEHAIKLIAANTGYTNPEYFHRIFHKLHGMTPLQYRKTVAENNLNLKYR